MEQSALSASLKMIQNWEEYLIDQVDLLLIRGTWSGCGKWTKSNLMKFNKGKRKILCLKRNTTMQLYSLGANHLESSFAEEDWRSWQTAVWPWASNISLQQRSPAASWAALGRALPAGQGRGFFFIQHRCDTAGVLSPVLGLPKEDADEQVQGGP